MGLIASDGNNTKEKGTTRYTRIKFHNKNDKLIKLFIEKYKNLFPDFNITKRIRRDGLIELDSSNSFFATICANLGIRSPQKKADLLPILHLKKGLIASFLRGYFDGDGNAYYKKKTKIKGTYSNIDLFNISEINAKRIHQMLFYAPLVLASLFLLAKDMLLLHKKWSSMHGKLLHCNRCPLSCRMPRLASLYHR